MTTTIGHERLAAIADSAWTAARDTMRAIDEIESCYADASIARTLGDELEMELVELRDRVAILNNAALRLDRCVASRH